MLKVLDDILAAILRIEAAVTKVTPLEPPKPLPGPPLYPCQPTPTDNVPLPGPGPGGKYDPSLTFVERFRRHEVLLMDGIPVRYTLPYAKGMAKATFTMVTSPMYGYAIQGERPALDRWVTDETGRELIRENGTQLNGGGMTVDGPFYGPIYLHIKPIDFTGWMFVEHQ